MVKRQRVVSLMILVFTLIGYGIFASGYSINMEMPAVKYRLGDEKAYENIIVRIEGTYQRRLFSEDIFKGTIFLEGYEFTNESSGFINLKGTLVDIRFDKDGHGRYEYIKVGGDGKIQYLMHGNIFIRNKFSTLTMSILEKNHSDSSSSGWSSKNGLMISAPAKSREEALYITNSLMKSNYE